MTSTQPHYLCGRLEIRIVSAKDLRNVALIGKMSPYAKVSLNANFFETSPCHQGDRTPIFKAGVVWNVKCSLRDEFSIQLKHKSGLHHGSIGRWVSDFKQILQLASTNNPKWVQLLTEDAFKPAGMVEVELKWLPLDDNSAAYGQQSLKTPLAPVPQVLSVALPSSSAPVNSVAAVPLTPSSTVSSTPTYPPKRSSTSANSEPMPTPITVPAWTSPPASNPAAVSPEAAFTFTPASSSPPPSAASGGAPASVVPLASAVVENWTCDECTYAGNKPSLGICEVCGATKKALRMEREAREQAEADAARTTVTTAATVIASKSPSEDGIGQYSPAVPDSTPSPQPLYPTMQPFAASISSSSVSVPAPALAPLSNSPSMAMGDGATAYYQPSAQMYDQQYANYPPQSAPETAPPAYDYYSPQPSAQPSGYGQYYSQPPMPLTQPSYGYQPQPQPQPYAYQPNAAAYNQFNY